MKFLNQFSPREKIIFYLTAFVIIIVLAYNFLIEPLYKKYQDLNQDLTAKDIKYERSLKLTHLRDKIKGDYNKLLSSVKLKASDEEEMASMLTQIETVARSAGVRIADVKPQGIKNKGFYKKFSVEIKIESHMSALTQFIYEILASQQVFKVERLQISAKGAGSDLVISNLSISRIAVPEVKL